MTGLVRNAAAEARDPEHERLAAFVPETQPVGPEPVF